MLRIRSKFAEPNYLVKEGKVYTLDGLLVLNLFVKSVQKMTEKEVYDYFTKFGAVNAIHLIPSKLHPTQGFVNFADSSSAAKALQTFSDTKKERPFYEYVQAAHSWNQPKGSKQCSPEDCYTPTNPSCSTHHKYFNILLLPDYCLEEICHNLPLSKQIHFARVNPRFHDVFQMYSKRAYRSFNCQEMYCGMSLFEATYFLRYVGVHIERLKVQFTNIPKIIEKFIGVFCVHVKRLDLKECNFSCGRLQKLLRSMNNLKELSVMNCRFDDVHIEVLSKSPSLEVVNVSGTGITGAFIWNMPQLVGLDLSFCYNLNISNFIDILKSLKKLKLLDLRNAIQPTDARRMLNAVLDYGKELELLKIRCHDGIAFELLAQLPNLKQLEIGPFFLGVSVRATCTEVLRNLIKYKSTQLEGLRIDNVALDKESFELISQLKELKILIFNPPGNITVDGLRKFCNLKNLQKIFIPEHNITNEDLLALLYNCKDLRCVNMTSCCKINIDLIPEAINIMKTRRGALKKPVVFLAYGTSINEAALFAMPDYKAAEEAGLIKVVFECVDIQEYDLHKI